MKDEMGETCGTKRGLTNAYKTVIGTPVEENHLEAYA
jgi:hypothetical protein